LYNIINNMNTLSWRDKSLIRAAIAEKVVDKICSGLVNNAPLVDNLREALGNQMKDVLSDPANKSKISQSVIQSVTTSIRLPLRGPLLLYALMENDESYKYTKKMITFVFQQVHKSGNTINQFSGKLVERLFDPPYESWFKDVNKTEKETTGGTKRKTKRRRTKRNQNKTKSKRKYSRKRKMHGGDGLIRDKQGERVNAAIHQRNLEVKQMVESGRHSQEDIDRHSARRKAQIDMLKTQKNSWGHKGSFSNEKAAAAMKEAGEKFDLENPNSGSASDFNDDEFGASLKNKISDEEMERVTIRRQADRDGTSGPSGNMTHEQEKERVQANNDAMGAMGDSGSSGSDRAASFLNNISGSNGADLGAMGETGSNGADLGAMGETGSSGAALGTTATNTTLTGDAAIAAAKDAGLSIDDVAGAVDAAGDAAGAGAGDAAGTGSGAAGTGSGAAGAGASGSNKPRELTGSEINQNSDELVTKYNDALFKLISKDLDTIKSQVLQRILNASYLHAMNNSSIVLESITESIGTVVQEIVNPDMNSGMNSGMMQYDFPSFILLVQALHQSNKYLIDALTTTYMNQKQKASDEGKTDEVIFDPTNSTFIVDFMDNFKNITSKKINMS
jgi:hypothetical protein